MNFRRYRLSQLRRADAFLYVRTAMSESGAFEVSYNVFAEPRAPMFFAIWKHAPIKTTLLRELEEVCDVTYREFEDPEELRGDLQLFFHRVARGATSTPNLAGHLPTWRIDHVGTSRRPVQKPRFGPPWVDRSSDRSHSVEPVLRYEHPPSERRPSGLLCAILTSL